MFADVIVPITTNENKLETLIAELDKVEKRVGLGSKQKLYEMTPNNTT